MSVGMAGHSCAGSADDESTETLRVMSYNILHGQGMYDDVELERAAAVITRLNPDVVTLQEIDNGCGRSGEINQMERLGEMTGMHHAFGEFMDFDGGQYGMGILSKYPLEDVANHRLPGGAEPRSALAATIKVGPYDREIVVIGIHFYRTETERAGQATKLMEIYQNETRPVILAGDFNSQPGTKVMQIVEEQWVNPDKGEDHFTFNSVTPQREIDYILYRPVEAFEVLEYDVVEEPRTSDHRPLIMELRLK